MIAKNKVVEIHYHLTNNDGEVIDSSRGKEPLPYLHGAGNIIPGLENALEGKTEGDSLDVVVQPAEGYGEVQPELLQKVPANAFPEGHQLEVGQTFTAQGQDGPFEVTVAEIGDDVVTVDANHPLAGVTLNFAVEVVSVRDATEEEVSHGHVHGPHGHHH
ncbi:MAG: FKBP-type peptidyl-prolyl cis-trans isomerase [bacterium]